jgi:hypothetical protein
VQRASRAKPAELKEKAWYFDDIKKANLPTSQISEEAEQAGEAFAIKQSQIPKSEQFPTPKKPSAAKPRRPRGTKLSFDPAKGFPISARAAEQLVKGGYMKHPDTVPSAASLASRVPPAADLAPGPQLPRSPQEPYPPSAHQANFVYSRRSVSP